MASTDSVSRARRGAAFLIGAALLCACAHRAPAPPPRDAAVFPTVRATHGGVQPTITLSGIIAPLQNITISSSVQEPALGVYVREGDYVHAGEGLAQLDTADLRANYNAATRNAEDAGSRVAQTRDQGILNIEQGKSALVSAQTQLAQAQQRLSLASTTLNRDRQLYAQGFLSRQVLDNDTTEYENDRQTLSSAQAAVQNAGATVLVNGDASRGLQRESVSSASLAAASARAQADQISVQISKAAIVSPVDGVVVNRNLNPGQYPGSSVLFTVQQIDSVYAVLNASSDEVFLIRPGAQANVTIGALHRARLRGIVEAVLGQPQPGGTNFVVKVRIRNPAHVLQSGMIASAEIALPTVYGIVIPASAFVDASHDAVRLQAPDGTTRAQTVRVLAEDGTHAVVQGVQRDARVVVQDP